MLRIEPPHENITTSFHVPIAKRLGDLTVHFDREITPDEQKIIAEELMCRQGVERIEFQSGKSRLAVIYYDFFMTSARTILKNLRSTCLFPFQTVQHETPAINVRMVGL